MMLHEPSVLGVFVCSGLLGAGALVITQGVASGHRIVHLDRVTTAFLSSVDNRLIRILILNMCQIALYSGCRSNLFSFV